MTAVTAEWTVQDSHQLTVDLVARDGHRMPLRGADREAAVRAMVARGIPAADIAERLCMKVPALQKYAELRNIALPRVESPWFVTYAWPSVTDKKRRMRDKRRNHHKRKEVPAS